MSCDSTDLRTGYGHNTPTIPRIESPAGVTHCNKPDGTELSLFQYRTDGVGTGTIRSVSAVCAAIRKPGTEGTAGTMRRQLTPRLVHARLAGFVLTRHVSPFVQFRQSKNRSPSDNSRSPCLITTAFDRQPEMKALRPLERVFGSNAGRRSARSRKLTRARRPRRQHDKRYMCDGVFKQHSLYCYSSCRGPVALGVLRPRAIPSPEARPEQLPIGAGGSVV